MYKTLQKKIEIVALNEHRDDVLMIYNGNRNTALMDFTNLKYDVKFVPNLFLTERLTAATQISSVFVC